MKRIRYYHIYFLEQPVRKIYLAASVQAGEESPRLTSGCQDEGVINARREGKSVMARQTAMCRKVNI